MVALWGVLWAVPPAWLATELVRRLRPAAARKNARDPYRLLPGLWLALGFATVCAAYVMTGWHGGNYVGLMSVSMTRLVMHHAPLVALMLCAMLEAGSQGEAEIRA